MGRVGWAGGCVRGPGVRPWAGVCIHGPGVRPWAGHLVAGWAKGASVGRVCVHGQGIV